MHLRSRQNIEGDGQQRIAGEDGCRLVEGLMHRRPAAAQVVVVHGGQIIVNQGIAVHAFERGAGHERALARNREQGAGLSHQEGS